MRLRLHIDRLVLDGFDLPPHGRALVQSAFEAELTRLFTSGGIHPALANGIAVPAVNVPPMSVPPNAKPAAIGTAIAQSVYGGIGR